MPERIEPSELEGSTILVGITHFSDDGSYEQEQYVGKASVMDRETFCLVELVCTDGETRTFPFDARSLNRAEEGKYRLRSTGEVVIDPDFLMTWETYKGEDK